MAKTSLRAVAVLAALGLSWIARAQPVGSALDAVLQKLRAPEWRVRSSTVDQLVADPQLMRSPVTRRALIQLLDQENNSLRDPKRPRRSEAEGEAYAEYYSALLNRVDSVVDPGDVASVSILAQSAYNGDSPFALKLASYGQTVVPALLAMTNDGRFRESDVYEVLGQVLRQHRLGLSKYSLTTKSVGDVENRIRTALRDPVPFVRGSAIRGAKAARDAASLQTLEQLSASDPYMIVVGKAKKYLIREEASEAIVFIKANPLAK